MYEVSHKKDGVYETTFLIKFTNDKSPNYLPTLEQMQYTIEQSVHVTKSCEIKILEQNG